MEKSAFQSLGKNLINRINIFHGGRKVWINPINIVLVHNHLVDVLLFVELV